MALRDWINQTLNSGAAARDDPEHAETDRVQSDHAEHDWAVAAVRRFAAEVNQQRRYTEPDPTTLVAGRVILDATPERQTACLLVAMAVLRRLNRSILSQINRR